MTAIEEPTSSSTPLKSTGGDVIMKRNTQNQSVDDLLLAIDKNISSASLNDYSDNSANFTSSTNNDDTSPIRPLNLKQQQSQSLIETILSTPQNQITKRHEDDAADTLQENVMQDIPRAPSFDELEFNTKVNRTVSLSRLSGPRQLANSTISRTFSTRSAKSASAYTTRDNSPSKKSVCFEESPPKVMEYQDLTPEHSDHSFDSSNEKDSFNSKWEGKVKPSLHPLPPLPPRHLISTPTSPEKDTTIGSSDEDPQDWNISREELKGNGLTFEEKLDLVLDNDHVSQRVQHDESFKGSGSPLKSMTKREEQVIYNIRNKAELEEEKYLRDASDLFEIDVRNNDKNSSSLQLDPVLKRKGSNSSLKDEERVLKTRVVSSSSAPITLENGLKNYNLSSLPQSTDDLISQSTIDSFMSASEIIQESDEVENFSRSANLKSHKPSESVSTIRSEDLLQQGGLGHAKNNSLVGSISSDLYHNNAIPRSEAKSKENVEIKQETIFEVEPLTVSKYKARSPDLQLPNSKSISSSLADNHGLQSLKKGSDEDSTEEELSLLKNQESTPALPIEETPVQIEDFHLSPPILLQDDLQNASFTDEFKETGLFNSSDYLSDDFRTIPHQHHPNLKMSNVLDSLYDDDDNDNDPIEEDHDEIVEKIKQELEEIPLSIPNDQQGLEEAFEDYKIPSLNPEALGHNKSIKKELPSFNSTLFYDKEPEIDENTKLSTPEIDYISIWHSLPKVVSLEPKQYSVRKRKPTPPKKVLKLLERTLKDESDDDEDISIEQTSRSSIDLKKRNSLTAKSFSRSSYIKVDSRRSSIMEEMKSDPESSYYNQSDISANLSANLSVSLLPDLTNSSDFANAFKEWEVESNQNRAINTSLPNVITSGTLRSIWNNEDDSSPIKENSRTPSVDKGKVETLIAKQNNNGEQAHVVSSQSKAEVVVSNDVEQHGVDIEIEQDSEYDIFNERFNTSEGPKAEGDTEISIPNGDSNLIAMAQALPDTSPIKAVKLEDIIPVDISEAAKFKKVNQFAPPPNEVIFNSADSDDAYGSDSKSRRFISGDSKVSGFDLNDEFDRVVQLQDHNYSVRQKNEVIVAKSSNKFSNEVDSLKSYVPQADNLKYVKTRQQTSHARIPSGLRDRTPLGAVPESLINSDTTKELPTPPSKRLVSDGSVRVNRIVSLAKSDIEPSSTDIVVKKNELSKTKSLETLKPVLPLNDKGRLYIHINSLHGLLLDEVKAHNAHFKLYVDNGKHKTSTPKMTLLNNVHVDKEFEVAIENDITDLHISLRISYHRPENELVEVFDKIPIGSNSIFGRLIGKKPKFRVEKRYITRKREKDNWDNKFANDGSFGKNKIIFNTDDNAVCGQTQDYSIELFNEWTSEIQGGKSFKRNPYLIGKLDVTMLYIPRTSPLETLPPTINIAKTAANHIKEQSNIHFEGFLFQEGGDCDLWKRRFFKLSGTSLIAHHETSLKPRAQINLLKVVDIIHSGNKRSRNSRIISEELLMSDTFKLSFKNGEIIHFNAETRENKIQWISVLERVVGLNKFHQPWVKLLAEKAKN